MGLRSRRLCRLREINPLARTNFKIMPRLQYLYTLSATTTLMCCNSMKFPWFWSNHWMVQMSLGVRSMNQWKYEIIKANIIYQVGCFKNINMTEVEWATLNQIIRWFGAWIYIKLIKWQLYSKRTPLCMRLATIQCVTGLSIKIRSYPTNVWTV